MGQWESAFKIDSGNRPCRPDPESPSFIMSLFVNIYLYRELIYNLILRDIKVRVKQSFLGYAWVIIPPLFQMIIFSILFQGILGLRLSGEIPYPVFLFCTLVPWQFFSEGIRTATISISNHAVLIRQVYFPKELLVLSSIFGRLFDLAISFILLMGLIIFYNIGPSLTFMYIPFLVMIQIILMLGFSLFFSAINTYYRDIGAAIALIMQIWMYASPIIYPLSKVPEKFLLIYQINPMVGIIDGYRRVIIEGFPPQWNLILYSITFSAILPVMAYLFFKNLEPGFADTV